MHLLSNTQLLNSFSTASATERCDVKLLWGQGSNQLSLLVRFKGKEVVGIFVEALRTVAWTPHGDLGQVHPPLAVVRETLLRCPSVSVLGPCYWKPHVLLCWRKVGNRGYKGCCWVMGPWHMCGWASLYHQTSGRCLSSPVYRPSLRLTRVCSTGPLLCVQAVAASCLLWPACLPLLLLFYLWLWYKPKPVQSLVVFVVVCICMRKVSFW